MVIGPDFPLPGTVAAPRPPAGAGTSRGKIRLSRAGAHWFDRVTGLNILLEGVVAPAGYWSRAPRYVSIALTNACELRCPFCYAPKVPGRLEAVAVIGWVDELDRSGTLGVGFGGGEPTAHPDFARICAAVADRTRVAVSFTTHGHRMNSRLAAMLRGNVHFARVSMDGLGETYAQLRGRSFDAFQRQLEIVASIAPFGLNVVINDDTLPQLDEIASFANRAGAQEILLLPEQPTTGRPGISHSAVLRLTEWVSCARPGIRLTMSAAGANASMPLAEPFPGESPLEAHAHIDALGLLRADAYSTEGVPVAKSILDSVDHLRARTAS